jgi:hypothetical protein
VILVLSLAIMMAARDEVLRAQEVTLIGENISDHLEFELDSLANVRVRV